MIGQIVGSIKLNRGKEGSFQRVPLLDQVVRGGYSDKGHFRIKLDNSGYARSGLVRFDEIGLG